MADAGDADVARLREENARLRAQLEAAQTALTESKRAAPTLRRALSFRDVRLTDEELAAMHSIFSLFDGGSGKVKVSRRRRRRLPTPSPP